MFVETVCSMSAIDILVRVIPPYFFILLFKLIFRKKFKLNIGYFLIAIILNFYFFLFAIPVIGVFDQMIIDLQFFSPPSLLAVLMWWGVCSLYATLKKKLNNDSVPIE